MDGKLRVRAVGWLALIALGFSFASFVVGEVLSPRGQVFFDLSSPFGPVPALLWVALIVALWLLSRRTPGAPFIVAAAATWSAGYGLGSVRGGFSGGIALLCWTAGPILLGVALLRSGFPRSVWLSALIWGGATVAGLAGSYAGILLRYPALTGISDIAYVILTVAVPVARWLFLGILGVSLLIGRAPTVRLTSASS